MAAVCVAVPSFRLRSVHLSVSLSHLFVRLSVCLFSFLVSLCYRHHLICPSEWLLCTCVSCPFCLSHLSAFMFSCLVCPSVCVAISSVLPSVYSHIICPFVCVAISSLRPCVCVAIKICRCVCVAISSLRPYVCVGISSFRPCVCIAISSFRPCVCVAT